MFSRIPTEFEDIPRISPAQYLNLVHFKVNWVSIPSSVYMWTSSITVRRKTRRVSKSQESKILFFFNLLKHLFQLTPTLTFDFRELILVIHQFETIFMMGESNSSRKEPSITFRPIKTETTYGNEETDFFPVNSSSNTEPGYSKKLQNEDLINWISALINARLTEFTSEWSPW